MKKNPFFTITLQQLQYYYVIKKITKKTCFYLLKCVTINKTSEGEMRLRVFICHWEVDGKGNMCLNLIDFISKSWNSTIKRWRFLCLQLLSSIWNCWMWFQKAKIHILYTIPEQKSYPRTHEKFFFNAKLTENLNVSVRDLNWFIVIEWGFWSTYFFLLAVWNIPCLFFAGGSLYQKFNFFDIWRKIKI